MSNDPARNLEAASDRVIFWRFGRGAVDEVGDSKISALLKPPALARAVCWWCCIDARSAKVSIPAVDDCR